MNDRNSVEGYVNVAADLRRRIVEIFDARPSEHILLTPGTLVTLQILFSNLKVNKIALTSREYYGREHFPGFDAKVFSVERFVQNVNHFKPDAVIVSVATWRGDVLPITGIFKELRATLGGNTPLLVADYAHAGAVGFPSPEDTGADVVCGDMYKWITPPNWYRNTGFVWLRSKSLVRKAHKAFKPFFLAADTNHNNHDARWLDPYATSELLKWMSAKGVNRSRLLARHKLNMELARFLATRLNVETPPRSSILWVEGKVKDNDLLTTMRRAGLTWKSPEGGLRILCRTESLRSKTCHDFIRKALTSGLSNRNIRN